MQILWLKLSNLKYKDFFDDITKPNSQKKVFTPNPEIILKSLEDREFLEILNNWDYLVPDGIGLYLWALILEEKSIIKRFIKLPLFVFRLFTKKQELFAKYWDKICGSDLTLDLLEYASQNNIKITILDLYNPNDSLKVANQKEFSNKLKSHYPDLLFDYVIYDTSKKDSIINNIKESDSKVLFSTLWMKFQEKSVLDIMRECKNIKLWLWVGSSFDYLTGFQKRAPEWFRKLWLEWLYRILFGPNKLKRLKRIKRAVFDFLFKVLFYKN